MTPGPGVSFVVPVRNGVRWLDTVLSAILAQDDGRPFEVVVVDDRSSDGSAAVLREYAGRAKLRVVEGDGRGAAAAVNLGIRHASLPIVCQVDQDVVVQPGWMARLAAELAAPDVAAAQGHYATAPGERLWGRVMGLDLAQRYARIAGRDVDHVCTGNSAYRAAALHAVGLFDESLGYGYDNDMSYRLGEAGWRLRLCPDARSLHRWRASAWSYLAQQYGLGYGRLDLVAKHPRRLAGDDVSGPGMILHALGMLGVLVALVAVAGVALAGGPWRPLALAAGLGLAILAGERLVAGLRAAVRFRDPAGLAFAPVHLFRDLAWAAALVVWTGRQLGGRRSRPADSM